MAEATRSVHQAHLRAMATMTLARQAALKAAKRQLSAQGLRPTHFSHRELVVRADAYLDQHREELIAEATQIVDHWQAEGFSAKGALIRNGNL
jgi:hypothetical protein